LKKSIADAGITKCHAAASFFAQVLGESKSLTFFEELKSK
jgi:predicted chitinase